MALVASVLPRQQAPLTVDWSSLLRLILRGEVPLDMLDGGLSG
jgi:hypothetical protein